ncbi:MAG: N-acetylmuramoyl-L-alanine amidase [Chloroflexi bacterium]|nr:N-acetylmuramoyl-L-alanine amidase [Chloroflexota bacterium]
MRPTLRATLRALLASVVMLALLLPTGLAATVALANVPSEPPVLTAEPVARVTLAGTAALAGVVAEGPVAEPACVRDPQPPLPSPGTPGAGGFWARYREPLPPAEVFNPVGRKRVGLQAGHWRIEEMPQELIGVGPGAVGGGKAEWEVNLEIAQRAADLLRAADVDVDLLPATIPVDYQAHAFVSIHADGDASGQMRGYKLGRAVWSATPEADDRLMADVAESYGEQTLLPIDPVGPSRRMTAYYAFNSRRYCHAIAPGTPSMILETGFLTSAADRQVLIGDPEASARGLAHGLLRFLGLADPAL